MNDSLLTHNLVCRHRTRWRRVRHLIAHIIRLMQAEEERKSSHNTSESIFLCVAMFLLSVFLRRGRAREEDSRGCVSGVDGEKRVTFISFALLHNARAQNVRKGIIMFD